MPRPFYVPALLRVFLLILWLGVSSPAQTKRLSDSQLDSYLKSMLTDYYSGKVVRAKVVIPATSQGLEIIDGRLNISPVPTLQIAAQPGDALLIRQLKFKSKIIEVQFEGDEPADEQRVPQAVRGYRGTKSSPSRSAPRITLRFSREITTRDLNIQSINRLLASAVETSSLAPKAAGPLAAPTASAETHPQRPEAPKLAEQSARAQNIPTATIIGELAGASAEVGELTIECSAGRARVYLDGAYSGWTPRTIRVRAGVHSLLIVGEGYAMWEQAFFIPGGKASLVRAELKRSAP